jgi:hypothetical protein
MGYLGRFQFSNSYLNRVSATDCPKHLGLCYSTAGFQSSNDLLINITGFAGTLPALGSMTVGNFFV